MQYHLHDNGWTVILDNFDFKTATQEDINQIAKLIANNTCVVAKNQSLTIDDELRIANMFKNPQPFIREHDPNNHHFWVEGTGGTIQRVTGELNEHGFPGIAGYVDEMLWHCNEPQKETRSPIIWLYGVKGTKGSRTSWNNNIMSYNDLSQEMKDKLSTLQIICMTGLSLKDERDGIPVDTYTPNIVHTNNAGKTGLFFPFLQMSHFKRMSVEESRKIMDPLAEHTIQEKYCYHHDWDDGDVVIAEQWLGIHKRWPFEGIATRLLHRIAFDFPDQDYV